MTNSIGEIPGAGAILIIGSNTSETHPVIGYRVCEAVRNGAALIVADPRITEMAKLADYHLRLRPGSDVALLNGLMHIIITEDLLDVDFVEKRTEGFEELKKTVAEYTPDRVFEITGVGVSDLRAAARAYATAECAAILYTMGITQHTTGTDNVLSVANLAMLTGNMGKPSTGVNPLRGAEQCPGSLRYGGFACFLPRLSESG